MPRGRPRGLPELPLENRPREAKRDQDQVVEIPGFPRRKIGDNRKAKADRQRFPASAGLQGNERAYSFMICSLQEGRRSCTRHGSVRKEHGDKPAQWLMRQEREGTHKASAAAWVEIRPSCCAGLVT
jgi:hypothetical protein